MNSTLQVAPTELATLLIPVSARQLILPNVTVAEIIAYAEPIPEDDVPTWYLGRFSWRGQEIPLVSFEAVNEEPFLSQGKDRRIAVLNGLVDEGLPFCGIVTEGPPRLMRVMSDEIGVDDKHAPGPAEIARVIVSGEQAAIPNVDYIQAQMLKLL